MSSEEKKNGHALNEKMAIIYSFNYKSIHPFNIFNKICCVLDIVLSIGKE